MSKNYDEIISKLINDLINKSKDDLEYIWRCAVSHKIGSYLYDYVKKDILDEKVVSENKQLFDRFKNVGELFNHLYWYLFWSIKWIKFRIQKPDKKVILTTFLPNKETTSAYLTEIENYAKEVDCIIINYSIIYSKNFLSSDTIYCFPPYLYKFNNFFHTGNVQGFQKSLYSDLTNLCNDIFPKFKLPEKELTKNLKKLDYIFLSFKNLLSMVHTNKILFLIQDLDYISERILFAWECNCDLIKTISVDHSLRVYYHLNNILFSKYYLIWGEYQFNKMHACKKYSGLDENVNVKIIGSRNIPINRVQSSEKKYWLFIIQSYIFPLIPTIHRSFDNLLQLITKIEELIAEKYPETELKIKCHPSDYYELKQYLKNNLVTSDLGELISKSGLIFIEDSSLSVELLKQELPVIYVSDSHLSDPFEFSSVESIMVMNNFDELNELVDTALSTEINMDARKKAIEYYYGKYYSLEKMLEKINKRNDFNFNDNIQ